MRCEQVREAVSARLDGVRADEAIEAVEGHLAGCAACRRWEDDAAALTRLVRTSVAPAPSAPDDALLAAVLAAAPGRGWVRAGRGLRTALAATGFAQFIIGVVQIGALGMASAPSPVGGMTSDHLWHESAAWNIAIGAGYAWIALRRERPAGALPMLTAFVSVLLLLSIGDLVTGEVAVTGLLSHGFVLVGYAILLALRHPGLDAPPGRRIWRLRSEPEESTEVASWRIPAPARGVTAQSDQQAA